MRAGADTVSVRSSQRGQLTSSTERPIDLLFKKPEGAYYHGLALAYSLLAIVLGISGLFSTHWSINLAATLWLAHGMTIAAYMIHECGHNTVFKENRHNARLGSALTWFCGASYGTYEDIRYKHFRHHVDNDDVVWFDYDDFFRRRPLVTKAVKCMEWCYIPAHDLLMHLIMIFTSFVIPQRHQQRRHNLLSIIIRGSLYLWILLYYPKAALLYALAYMIMMTVLRFMDSLQHDYDSNALLFSEQHSPNKGDLQWEQEHTFSNVISFNYQWPNWLVLNFGFHNAHHAKPTTPWYELPQLHRELFGNSIDNVITLWPQLKIFHRHRVDRILFDNEDLPSYQGRDFLRAAQAGKVSGGNAASFLTSF